MEVIRIKHYGGLLEIALSVPLRMYLSKKII